MESYSKRGSKNEITGFVSPFLMDAFLIMEWSLVTSDPPPVYGNSEVHPSPGSSPILPKISTTIAFGISFTEPLANTTASLPLKYQALDVLYSGQ